jgi:hypothetical protein
MAKIFRNKKKPGQQLLQRPKRKMNIWKFFSPLVRSLLHTFRTCWLNGPLPVHAIFFFHSLSLCPFYCKRCMMWCSIVLFLWLNQSWDIGAEVFSTWVFFIIWRVSKLCGQIENDSHGNDEGIEESVYLFFFCSVAY